MNFKTPFKVLTTAALIGTLSLSAVAPGVASAADKTVTAQAETPANFALEKVILVKGDSKISVSFDTYIDVLGNEKALNGYELAYVVAANGEVFALDTYVDFYEAGNTEEEVVEKLSKAGKTSEVTEVKDGAFNDGKLEPVEDTAATAKADLEKAVAAAKATEIKDAAAKAELTKAIEAAEKAAAKEDATKEELEAAKAELTKAVAAAKKADEEAALEAKVESVTAINANEIKVTFNKAVSKDSLDATDFVVSEFGTSTNKATVADVQLSEDGKSAVILLDTSVTDPNTIASIPVVGVDVKIAEGAILDQAYNKFAKFEAKQVTAPTDKVAPKLLSATTDGATVELTFDEPIDWTNAGVKINQGAINETVATDLTQTKAGKYVYTVTPTAGVKTGTNDIEISKIADIAGNVETLISTTVDYKADTKAPAAKGIKAAGQYSFIVEFSKPVGALNSANFEIKKGNYTLTSSDFTSASYVDANGDTSVGATKYVLVTLNNGTAPNELFAEDEKEVTLNVKVKGYQDTQTTPVQGLDYNGTVKLAVDTVAPKVVSEKLVVSDTTAKTITIPFDETLNGTPDATKVSVKAGSVKVTPSSVATSGKNLVLTFSALTPGTTYNVSLGEGAVEDTASNKNAATTLSHTVAGTAVVYNNAATITQAGAPTQNIIEVDYGTEVEDVATELSSYKLNDAALPAGTEIYFTDADKDTVQIVLPKTYTVSAQDKSAKVTVVADTVKYADESIASGSTTEPTAINEVIELNDNVAPTVSNVEYIKNDDGLATGLKVTFSEAVNDAKADVDTFLVKQGSTDISYTVETGVASTKDEINDKVLTLTFATAVEASDVTLKTNKDATAELEDVNGNALTPVTTAIAAK